MVAGWSQTSIGYETQGDLRGTYVNRELVDSAVLDNGDQISMGKFRLVFLTTNAPA